MFGLLPEIFLAVIVIGLGAGYWLDRKELYAAAVRRLEQKKKPARWESVPPPPPTKPSGPPPNPSTR